MEINSKRAKAIDAYLESHPDAELGEWNIEIAGVKERKKFYRFPIKELLLYNKKNRRLSIEVQKWEKDKGREIDIYNDRDILISMLLELDKGKTKDLEEDLLKKGQMEPGAITHDGFVINGNRRMALLEKRLHPKESTGKWEYLEAVRLPAEITEKDLWKIEAGLQLSKDKVAPYHPVKDLIMINQGIETGLEPKELAAAIYGMTEEEVCEALERLKLIDDFLDFMGQVDNYGFIVEFGLHEYFINMRNCIVIPAKKLGIPKRELTQNLIYSFELLRAAILEGKKSTKKGNAITHLKFRNLREIFYKDARAKDAFTASMNKSKKVKDVSPDKVIEDFNDAIEVLSINSKRFQPVKLIEKAIQTLESIDKRSKYFCKDKVEITFKKLLKIVHNLEKELNSK